MNNNEKIWFIAKQRFLQCEASIWTINNKILELLFIAGLVVWIYFEFIYHGTYMYIKFIGLVVTIFTFAMIRARQSSYCAFFDGYECGFKDAATKNLDYWSNDRNQHTDDVEIDLVLKDIDKAEQVISEKNLAARTAETQDGLANLLGFFLTWRKLR